MPEPIASASRTEILCRAIVDELRRRRAFIDSSPDLVSVAITCKLQDTEDPIRSVLYEDQRVITRRSTGR